MNFLLLTIVIVITFLLIKISILIENATKILKEIEYVLKAQESIENCRIRTTMQANKLLEQK